MIVYIKGKTRVKGVQNKDVYYVGCVESDGYIYFNDSMSYRIPTPATLREETDVSVTEVQIWYTVRNCWIRANYFTQLKVYGVDFEHIYNRIGTLETKVATLEQKVATLESKVATLESKVATLESKVATLESKVATLETTVADHEVRIVACEAQIQGLNTRLVTAENNISSLQVRMSAAESNITTLLSMVHTINNTLGDIRSLVGNDSTLELWLRAKYNEFISFKNDTNASISWCETNINALVPVVTDHSNRISALEGDYTSLSTLVTTINNGLNSVTNLVNTLQQSFNIFVNDFANYRTSADRAINDLGHKALGDVPSYGYGNGDSLLYLLNKMVECANYINSHGGSITVDARTIWTQWTDV